MSCSNQLKNVSEFYNTVHTALMQHCTHTTLFLDSTGLLKRSMFAILKKIARVANNTQSKSFHKYRFLDRLHQIGHG